MTISEQIFYFPIILFIVLSIALLCILIVLYIVGYQSTIKRKKNVSICIIGIIIIIILSMIGGYQFGCNIWDGFNYSSNDNLLK